MKLQVYSVFDRAVTAFLPPMFVRAKGEMLRQFQSAVNSPDHQFHKHLSDYTLFYLGEFDDAGGVFSAIEPLRVVSASEVLEERPAG